MDKLDPFGVTYRMLLDLAIITAVPCDLKCAYRLRGFPNPTPEEP
jgi:hypothetical protein